ncbi:exonuclease domain-containing protein [Flavobacterium sp.]|jgi:DNA polymerase-3 subunit epsilon|uniref:exonuclease domain-containing protein n=1 Tax=Flavobacterium sp. TaxID=239 RepID=UPI0037BE8A75
MLQWLNNNKYPEFWKNYLSNFKDKSNKYVVLSIESTGLNSSKDVILAFSAVTVNADRITIREALELYISYSKSEIDLDPNEFILVSKIEKKTEHEAIELIVNYIGNATLIGHRVNKDIDLLNVSLAKFDCGNLKNEALDIEIMFNKVKETIEKKYTLEEMCKTLSVPVNERNSVADDTFSIALLFLKLKTILKIK